MHAAIDDDARFHGFTREGLELLRQLEAHNDRGWFAARRPLFQELLTGPALDLVVDMGPLLRRRVSAGLRAEPRVGGSLLRMQHDARYLRGSPFRTHLELWFWEGRGPSHQHPGFFVQVSPVRLVLGAGITLFPPEMLHEFRLHVDLPSSGRELMGVLRRLELAGYHVSGDRLRRTPRPFPAEHERALLLRQLGLRVERAEPLPPGAPESMLGPFLPELLISGFLRLRPLHHWLRRLG